MRDAGGPDCLETRKAWIDTAGAARRRCEAGDSGACVDLGDTYRAAESPDDAIEAFAKACEIRGLDTEAEGVYLDRPWGECSNDARIPHHHHPGPRGRCGTFAIFNTSPGHARHEINEPAREGPGPASPRRPARRAPAKIRIGEPGHTKGDYPTEKLAAELEAMRERFAQCAGESPEIEGKYSFIGTFVLDRAGVPAFFQLQHQANDVGQVSGEPRRRLRTCFELIVRGHRFPPPPSGKGMRFVIPFTVNPDAAVAKPPPPPPM